jgi:hypothetical protein
MVWSLAPNIYQEERPDTIMRVVKNARYAASRHIKALPHFQSLTRNGTHLMLTLSSGYRPLRAMLHLRELMQHRAPVLIRALLSAYLEVSKAHKLTLRNLTPSNVMLDRSFSQVIFADISELCQQDDGTQPSTLSPLPYSAMLLPAYRKSPRCHTIFDRWSVGVIMLEILLGTSAVMTITSIPAAEDLFDLSRKFLDKDTVAVIKYLLFAT